MDVLYFTIAVAVVFLIAIVIVAIIVIAIAIVVIIARIVFSKSNKYTENVAAQTQEN